MNTSAFGVEKGTLIRVPATANLMLDSEDRNSTNWPSCWDFQIQKNQALISGFFSRIGTTEMTLEWCEPNISDNLQNTTMTVDISGVGGNTHAGSHVITFEEGHYTVADALEELVVQLNDISGTTGTSFAIVTGSGQTFIEATGGVWSVDLTEKLAGQIDLNNTILLSFGYPNCPDLRPYRYLDFVCDQLTAVQDVKDGSTQSAITHDVLLRWYFAEDAPENTDVYGYPILQGYIPFKRRRIYNPPKQIKWEQNLQVGNLRFAVYTPDGVLPPESDPETEWLMTLQLTEG